MTFALLIRTPTTRVGFINYFLRTLFYGILAMVKKRSLNPAEIPVICHKRDPPPPSEAKLHTFVFYLHKAISVFYLAVSLSLDGGC